MAVFNPIVITTAGISLLSQAMAGKGTLTFTSVATSTTVIPYNISNIQAMTALSGIMQTVVPVSAVLKTGNVQVSSIFSNSGVTNAYTANTIGLYAALGNGAQTLFAVAIATTPDNIPVQNDLSPSNFYYQFNIAISDTSQLTVTVPEDGSLPASVFNQMFPGIAAPGQNNDGDALVYNASSGAWGYVNTETVFTTVSGSGEFVSLQKTLADDFKQIQLFGKSVQKPTTGAQLFNVNVCKNETNLQYKITIDDYATGKITVSIDNPEGAVVMPVNRLSDYCPTMAAGKTYYLSGKHDGSNGDISLVDVSDTWGFGTSREITEQDLQSAVQFGFGTYSNIMIVEGSTEKPYEVYTGGEAATEPTPEFPLPITSAGNYDAEEEKYEVGIAVTGAQLFDASKLPTKTQGGATVTNNGDGSFTVSGSGALSETYLNQYNYSNDDSKKILKKGILSIGNVDAVFPYFRFVIRRSDGTSIALLSSESGDKSSIEITDEIINLIFTENAYVSIDFYGFSGDIKSGTVKPMVYQSENGVWEPFKQQLSTLQLPNPLRGIPVDSGGNYTDETGQQWICDYIDRERGVYVQCVQEIVFDGSEDENWSFSMSNNNRASIVIANKIKETDHTKRLGVCDKLKYNVQVYYDTDFNTQGFVFTVNMFFVRLGSEYNEIDSLQKFKDYLKLNNLKLIYAVETPIETNLTSDQIAALNLSTYQGITNIGTDTMPQVGMAVESRGFNLAGDLAQNLIDLQSTVRSQGTAITQNETDIENINNVLNSPLVSYNGLLPVVNPSGIYTYKSVADIVYPIGSIYLSVNNINPRTIFGGTWVSWGSGRVPVGVNTSVSQFATVEQTGGEITHTLTTAEMPSHDHSISGGACTTGSGGSHNHTYGATVHPAVGFTLGSNGYSTVTKDNQNTSSNGNHSHSVPDHAHDIGNTGGGQTHNNLQPYITCYMWKRTA